eukprot:2398067-Pleurochrysis_carterae.AAC.1
MEMSASSANGNERPQVQSKEGHCACARAQSTEQPRPTCAIRQKSIGSTGSLRDAVAFASSRTQTRLEELVRFTCAWNSKSRSCAWIQGDLLPSLLRTQSTLCKTAPLTGRRRS